MRLLCIVGLFVTLLHVSTSLLLGAFNIQAFGPKKAGEPKIMGQIEEIVSRYDIILIQEVRGSGLIVPDKLKRLLNPNPLQVYDYVTSVPLGSRPQNNERYVFFYKVNQVSVTDTYQDTSPVFSRAPFVVRFKSPHTVVKDFVLIPQHTSPPSAVAQINALHDVATDVGKKWTENIILLGDFNAGCTYVRTADWNNIRLFIDKTYHWLIDDSVDTTVSTTTDCPYDRIVASDDMVKGVDKSSAGVYNFKAALGITDDKAASAISDHYPVEVKLI